MCVEASQQEIAAALASDPRIEVFSDLGCRTRTVQRPTSRVRTLEFFDRYLL